MKQGALLASAGVLVAVALAGGYWWGKSGAVHGTDGATATSAAAEGAKPARKLLYYRNPMGLPDTSPVPKKDPMGMDYVPVYEGEEPQASSNDIKVSADKVQKMGVRTEPAAMRQLDRMVRAAGRVEVDERRVYAISPKFEGWVERLYVNTTGQPVARGQPLFDVYAPELVSAQREYAIASDAAKALQNSGDQTRESMKSLAESSLTRLRNWDISSEQVKQLAESGEVRRSITFRSPVAGVVMEKKALQGMRFMPGEALFQIADLSTVWVLADVYEQDLEWVKLGGTAKVRITAYPDRGYEGRIAFIYPTLKPETRTIPVRIELRNPGGLLKPAMFAQVELAASGKGRVLAVPSSAVIDSGVRQVVLVQKGEGRFEPREVKLGRRSDDYVEVTQGVQDGEPVVVAANFLIDAESNLKAAIGGFGAPGAPGAEGAAQAGTIAKAGHRAEGKVQELDPKARSVSIHHGPIASLNWPEMTMEFKVANDALNAALKPGSTVAFEFVERGAGEWVITKVEPAGKAAAAAPASAAHQGH